MNDRQLIRHLADAADHLNQVANVIATVLPNIADARAGWPASSRFEGDRGSGHTTVTDENGMSIPAVSDPTGEAAVTPDPAAADHRQLARSVETIHSEARKLYGLMAKYQSRRALPSEKMATNANKKDGCSSCARLKHRDGEPRWEPTHRTTDVNGKHLDLCLWCYKWFRSQGVLPSTAELDRHHQGHRVRRPA